MDKSTIPALIWSYWRFVLKAAWFQTVDWFGWPSTWWRFILSVVVYIIGLYVTAVVIGLAQAFDLITALYVDVWVVALLLPAIYVIAIIVTPTRRDADQNATIARLQQALDNGRDRQEIGLRLEKLWERGNALVHGATGLPVWRVAVVKWVDDVRAEAVNLSRDEGFMLQSIVQPMDMGEQSTHILVQRLNGYLNKLRLVVSRHLKPPEVGPA